MRILKQSVITSIVTQTGLSYESVLMFFYERQSDPATLALIEQAVCNLGHVEDVHAQIRPPSSRTIGVVIPEYMVDDFTGRILSGMSTVLETSEYQATFHSIDVFGDINNAQNYYRALFAIGAAEDIFIVTNTSPIIKAIIPFCEQEHRPSILMDHDITEDTGTSPALCIDNRQATLDVTRYLFSLGHRRIGFITGRMSVPSAAYRLQGYKDGLSEANLPFDPNLVVEGDWQVNTSADATQQLLHLEQCPTAIIASNDVMAISAMFVLSSVGLKIPQDISVVGFDDIEIASSIQPSLSTVRQPMMRMGQKAIEVAIMLIEGKPLTEPKMSFRTSLVVRDSTGLAPK